MVHEIDFTCDAEKMYLQVEMDPRDCEYQRFVWRENEEDELMDACLTRLTFGEGSAQHTAIRTFKQAALDGEAKYPLGAQVVEEDFYVDDGSTGASTLEECIEKREQTVALLRESKFELRKFASNRE